MALGRMNRTTIRMNGQMGGKQSKDFVFRKKKTVWDRGHRAADKGHNTSGLCDFGGHKHATIIYV